MKKFFKGFNLKKILKIFNLKKVLKLIGPKNLLIAVLLITLVVLIGYGIGIGFGGGAGSGEGTGNSKMQSTSDSVVTAEDVEEDVVPTIEPKEEEDDADVFEGTMLAVNVVGNEYFYNNERISLEEFIAIIGGIEGKVVIEVNDDSASLRAYSTLLDILDENNVNYIEK